MNRASIKRVQFLAASLVSALLMGHGLVVAAPASAAGISTYDVVTLGDSYASGEGNPGFTSNAFGDSTADGCHRSARGGHTLFGQQLTKNTGSTYINAACSGATVDSVIGGANGELTQLAALGPNTKIVTISAGGNDVGFQPLLVACANRPSGKELCSNQVRQSQQELLKLTTPSGSSELDTFYQYVKTLAPNAKLFVVGSPLLFPTTYKKACFEFQAEGQQQINKLITSGNVAIRAAAERNGATFVDIARAFAGHTACDVTRPWINAPSPVNVVYSFHPNQSGQNAIAAELLLAYSRTPLTITSDKLATATTNTPYSVNLDALGYVGSLRWISTGTLPPGISFQSSSGRLSGTPTKVGQWNLTFIAYDQGGRRAAKTYSLSVSAGSLKVTFSENYSVMQEVTQSTNYSDPLGSEYVVPFSFAPCGQPSCETVMTRTSGVTGRTYTYPLTVDPGTGTYSGSTSYPNTCVASGTSTVLVQNGYVHTERVAIRPGASDEGTFSSFTGTLTQTGVPTAEGLARGCPPYTYVIEMSGTRIS